MKSVLIANRGEIAVRIIRACRELGIRSIAVYSDADAEALHTRLADEAYRLGPAPSSESYLRTDRILDVARESGAEGIHPGYGFMAERAEFAKAVVDAGLVFIGPSPATIDMMGDKTRARTRMEAAGVPIVPGTTTPLADAAEAEAVAESMGYPVLLKAAAGGGGKGMRVAEDASRIRPSFEAAAREAKSAFGDGSIYIEKYLSRPRHIEIQVLGDLHGGVVHLGERECSIQRRHQKLVEEAPSVVLDPETRAAMGEAAVRAAQAVEYAGAGTIEFLWQDGDFFFLEMNTRIQVEHPVTELVTGIDLVEWQLRVARGEALPWTQEGIRIEGHAIECRITSEDPDDGFLPSTGTIRYLELPQGPGVRWDGGVAAGTEVGLHYDPLLGKVIAWGADRATAIERMDRALREFVLVGVEHCGPFHRRVLAEEDFRAGNLSIRYLEEHPELTRAPENGDALQRLAAAAAVLLEDERRRTLAPPRIRPGAGGAPRSAWQEAFAPGASEY
jgi:acetyl-CoA carboxylase, biotin carboxylase subunit